MLDMLNVHADHVALLEFSFNFSFDFPLILCVWVSCECYGSQLLLRRYHTSLSTFHVCGSSADHCDYSPCPRNLIDGVALPAASPRASAASAVTGLEPAESAVPENLPAHDDIPHQLVEPKEEQLHERHLRMCSSCRMARYCSRSCQVCMPMPR
jgi:hypothetical protein